MIRKSAIIIILVLMGLVGAGVFFLGDSFVGDMAEAALGKALKTEVAIAGFDIDLSAANVSFESLAVMDPDHASPPLANTGPAEFDLLGMQLLAKKLVIHNMSLHDVVIDSELHKLDSEADPDQDSAESSVGKLVETLPELNLDVLAKKLDIDRYVHPEKLKSIAAIKQAEQEGRQRITYWNETIRNSTLQADIRQLQLDADRLRKTKFKTILDYQKAITDLQTLQANAKKITREIKEINQNANRDLTRVTTNLGNVKTLTEQDIKEAEKLARLKDINAEQIGMMLFGKQVVTRYEQVQGYLNQVRGFFGEREEKPKRREGHTITFPITTTVYPGFLIQHLNVNGQLTSQAKPLINWAGAVTGLTLEQDLTGKPTVFDVSGDEIGKPAQYHIQGVFDNRGQQDTYTLAIKGTRLQIEQVEIKKEDPTWPNHMSSQDTELNVSLTITAESMSGSMSLLAKSVQFGFAKENRKRNSETDRAIRETFEDLKAVTITSTLNGSLENPTFSVSSNIDKILAQRLDAMVGKKIREAKTKIRRTIEGQVKGARDSAEKRLEREKQQVLKQMHAYQAELNRQKKRVDDQVKVFKKKQKKSIEDEARKKLESLFK